MKLDDKQKKLLLFGGAAVVLLFFVLAKAQAAKQTAAPTYSLPSSYGQASPSVDLSPLTGFLQTIAAGLADTQTAVASISQNQVTQSSIDLTALGAASWLSCLPVGGGRPDAACIKAKGGVGIVGQPSVSNVKTQKILDTAYTGPYAQCKKADGSYDLQCVGFLIAGQPTLKVATSS